jgi:hypothetical protein
MTTPSDFVPVPRALLNELIDEAQASVNNYHDSMAGYRASEHARLDLLMLNARNLQGLPSLWDKACPSCAFRERLYQEVARLGK